MQDLLEALMPLSHGTGGGGGGALSDESVMTNNVQL